MFLSFGDDKNIVRLPTEKREEVADRATSNNT